MSAEDILRVATAVEPGGLNQNSSITPTPFLLLLGREAVCTLRRRSSSSVAPRCGGFSVETCARHWAERTSVSHSSPPLARAAADSNPSHLPRA